MDPTFDIVSRLRSRRLRLAGHILRLEATSLLRRVVLAEVQRDLERDSQESGGLLMDALPFDSVEELAEQAADRKAWRKVVRALLPDLDSDSDSDSDSPVV